jgi:hypothetical protein
MAEGLVEGTAFAVDASLIVAYANKQRAAAGFDEVDRDAIARTRRSFGSTSTPWMRLLGLRRAKL